MFSYKAKSIYTGQTSMLTLLLNPYGIPISTHSYQTHNPYKASGSQVKKSA